MSCPACEQNRLAGKRFCTSCGARLIEDAAPETPVEPAREPERSQWTGVYNQAPAQTGAYGMENPSVPPVQQGTYGMENPSVPPVQQGTYGMDNGSVPPAGQRGYGLDDPTPAPAPGAQSYTNYSSYTPAGAQPPQKKKKSILPFAVIGVLIALVGVVIALIATGVIDFDKKSDKKADTVVTTDVDEKEQAEEEEDDAEDAPVAEPDGSYVLADKVLVDDSLARATLISVTDDEENVYFKIKLENTGDETCEVRCVLLAVNGYEVHDFLESIGDELAPGESLTKTITFEKEVLDLFDMEVIDSAMLNVYTVDPADDDNYPLDEYVTIYPTGLSASTFDRPERITSSDERVILDDSRSSWIMYSCHIDDDDDLSMFVYTENKSGKEILLAITDITVNGIAYDGHFGCTLQPKNGGYDLHYISSEELAEMGLSPEDVHTVSFTLLVWDVGNTDSAKSVDYTWEF